MPEFFDRYINLVVEENLFDALEKSKIDIENINIKKLKEIGDKVYQPGKWTVKDIFQHLIDNDRIQAYRALRFARGDKTVLPSYDEKLLAAHSFAHKRNIDDILNELLEVKSSNIMLFKSFEVSTIHNIGICFRIEISVLALGFQMVGHQQHHLKVIEEKYYPLL